MTKEQKKRFKKLDGKKKRLKFVSALLEQQSELGKYRHWLIAYDRKCRKKGVENPVL